MTLQQWTYLLVLAFCVVVTLPLEFVLQARVYRRWPRMLLAVLPVSAVFLVWDFLAAGAGWWWFDTDYLTGLFIGRLPIEEVLFFLVVPVCGLLTFEAVRHLRPQWAPAAQQEATGPAVAGPSESSPAAQDQPTRPTATGSTASPPAGG